MGPSPDLAGQYVQETTTTAPLEEGDHTGTRAYRGDVRESAIQELEQGQIPTNSLGDDVRMLGVPSYFPSEVVESKKRKRGGNLGYAAIAYTM